MNPEISPEMKIAASRLRHAAQAQGIAILLVNLTPDQWSAIRWAIRREIGAQYRRQKLTKQTPDAATLEHTGNSFGLFAAKAIGIAVAKIASRHLKSGGELPMEVSDWLGDLAADGELIP